MFRQGPTFFVLNLFWCHHGQFYGIFYVAFRCLGGHICRSTGLGSVMTLPLNSLSRSHCKQPMDVWKCIFSDPEDIGNTIVSRNHGFESLQGSPGAGDPHGGELGFRSTWTLLPVYIYIERERSIFVYLFIYICIYIHL
jgi:hypothetical protein